MPSLLDLLQEDLTAAALKAPAAPRQSPSRFTAWSNAASFTDEGYLARVMQLTCLGCGSSLRYPLGIFHAERAPNGTRRLQAIPPNGQWPLADGLPMEVEQQQIRACVDCLSVLGFTAECPAPVTTTLKVPHATAHS